MVVAAGRDERGLVADPRLLVEPEDVAPEARARGRGRRPSGARGRCRRGDRASTRAPWRSLARALGLAGAATRSGGPRRDPARVEAATPRSPPPPRPQRPASGCRSRPSGDRAGARWRARPRSTPRAARYAEQREVPEQERREPDDADVDAELRVRRLARLDVDARALGDDARVPEPVALRVLERPPRARRGGSAGGSRPRTRRARTGRRCRRPPARRSRAGTRAPPPCSSSSGPIVGYATRKPAATTTEATAEHHGRHPPLRDAEHDEPDRERDEGGAGVGVEQRDEEERGDERPPPAERPAHDEDERDDEGVGARERRQERRDEPPHRALLVAGVVDPVLRQGRRGPRSRGRAARGTSPGRPSRATPAGRSTARSSRPSDGDPAAASTTAPPSHGGPPTTRRADGRARSPRPAAGGGGARAARRASWPRRRGSPAGSARTRRRRACRRSRADRPS